MSATQQCQQLHARFTQLTSRSEPFRFHDRAWFELLKCPEYEYDVARLEADMAKVVTYLRRQMAAEKRNAGCLKLRNFLQPDQFFADLAEASAARPSKAGEWVASKPPAAATPQQGEKPMTEAEIDAIRAQQKEKLREFTEKIGGRGA